MNVGVLPHADPRRTYENGELGGGSTLGPSVILGLVGFLQNLINSIDLVTFDLWVVYTGGPHTKHRFVVILAHKCGDLLILSLHPVPHQ